ncbi:MAG: lytic transglycosylase domain-containing protein, partial [Sciscionella sp.]
DVPLAALNAYHQAASSLAVSDPGCHLSWGILAAIGQVESDHGRYGGAVVLANGNTFPHILGPPLNGHGVARVPDTDNGRLDGDKVWDRAVGPMQFLPSTWAAVGVDGNGDGVADPNNIFDAALTAARYLCSGYPDMQIAAQARGAILSYNHSQAYVNLVLTIAHTYDSGVVVVVPNGHRKDAVPQRTHRARHNVHHRSRHPTADTRRSTHRTATQKTPTTKKRTTPPVTTKPTGVLTGSGTTWYLDGKRVDLGLTSRDLKIYQQDYNKDGTLDPLGGELLALRGKAGTKVYPSTGPVTSINGLRYTANPTGVITGAGNNWYLDGTKLNFGTTQDLSTVYFAAPDNTMAVGALLATLVYHTGTEVTLSGGTGSVVSTITAPSTTSGTLTKYSYAPPLTTPPTTPPPTTAPPSASASSSAVLSTEPASPSPTPTTASPTEGTPLS